MSDAQKDNFSPFRLGYTHDFETMSETTAYRNYIKNSELETRKSFEQETENIPLTRQTYLVTILNNNPLTRSTDSSKNEESHKPEVNLDPEPLTSDLSAETTSLYSRSKKKKRNKKKKCHKHRKYDSSDPSLSDDSDSSDNSHYRRKRRKNKNHRKNDWIKLCATLTAKCSSKHEETHKPEVNPDREPSSSDLSETSSSDSRAKKHKIKKKKKRRKHRKDDL